MKIEYINKKMNSYEILETKDCYGTVFRSTIPGERLHEETICLYDNHLNRSQNLYQILADSNTKEKALDFCNAYGSLSNRNEWTMNIYKEIDGCTDSDSPKYDYIIYDHFKYYQISMYCLFSINQILQLDDLRNDDLRNLFAYSFDFITNPYFDDFFQLEFSSSCYDIDEMCLLLSPYPLIMYIYMINTNRNLSPSNSQEKSEKIHHLLLSKFPEENLSIFFQNTLKLYQEGELPHDYLINRKKDLINLARYIFYQGLSFSVRQTRPEVHFSTTDNISFWRFDSLANAIFFHFYIEHSETSYYKRCANDKCQELFLCSTKYPRTIYCSRTCAHRVANRNYKERQKIITKTKANQ